MGDVVNFDRTDGIVILTIDRPGEMNMLSDEAIDLLNSHFLDLEKDLSVRTIVLTGAGKDFFCGGIFNPAQKAKLSSEQVRFRRSRAVELFERIEKGVHPVIGAINGRAQAGGFEMVLACDIRIAATHSTFSLPETSWGGFPGAGGPFRLSRIVGMGKAMEIIMTGRDVKADEALRMGLVEQVVTSQKFESEVFKTAELISATSPLGNRVVKKLIRASFESSRPAIQSLSDSLREFVGSSEDAAEGRLAHLEGRRPRFIGK